MKMKFIKKLFKKKDKKNISDGHHTFADLYLHRYILYIELCKKYKGVWKSKLHDDGTMFENSFILGINKKFGKQITYHLPLHFWSFCKFAKTLKQAPKYDGHTSGDVLNRLINMEKYNK